MTKTPSLIILHGWSIDPAKAQKWQAFRDALAAQHIASRFLKIPGLSAPLSEVWDLNDYVKWLDAELKNDEQVILLGHSFGGQIATRYTAQHANKIAQLILIDSSGIRDHSLIPTLKRFTFMIMAKIGKIFFKQEKIRRLLYILARERDYQQAPPLLRRTMSQILDDEVVADLPRIVCPTLLIWGKEDQVTPLFLGRRFTALVPHAELQVIDGARHSPQYTHPQVVAEQIKVFLEKQGIL